MSFVSTSAAHALSLSIFRRSGGNPPLCCFLDLDFHRHARSPKYVHQCVETKEPDLSLEQRIEPRLSKPQELCGFRLRHAASPVEILDAHHEVCAQPEILSLVLAKTDIDEYVSAAPGAFHSSMTHGALTPISGHFSQISIGCRLLRLIPSALAL